MHSVDYAIAIIVAGVIAASTCASPKPACPAAARPARTLWLAVQGATDAETAEIRVGARAWEYASCGAIALPVIASDAAPSEDTVSVTITDTADEQNLRRPTTVAWTDTRTWRRITIYRPRARLDWLACITSHEIGHVLQELQQHDTSGLMAQTPSDCTVTRELAASVINGPLPNCAR